MYSMINSVFSWLFEIRELVKLSRHLHAYIAYGIAFAKITARICLISHCLRDLTRLNSIVLPSANDKMYDDKVFADRFCFQLIMFKIWELVGHLDSFMLILRMNSCCQNQRKNRPIFPLFCLIWYGWIQSYCRIQTTRCTMMKFSLIDSVTNWLCIT